MSRGPLRCAIVEAVGQRSIVRCRAFQVVIEIVRIHVCICICGRGGKGTCASGDWRRVLFGLELSQTGWERVSRVLWVEALRALYFT